MASSPAARLCQYVSLACTAATANGGDAALLDAVGDVVAEAQVTLQQLAGRAAAAGRQMSTGVVARASAPPLATPGG